MNFKTLITAFAALLLITSCTTQAPKMYTWGDYSNATYNFIKSHSDADRDALIKTYENIIKKQKGTRKVVPPGIYADYGYLLIQIGQDQKGKEMLEKEVALYPESKVFIERIINNVH